MASNVFFERQEEISSGFKNALSRGETLGFARVTFLNAGYDPQIVNAAANKLLSGQQGVPVKQAGVANVKGVPQAGVANARGVPGGKLPLRAQRIQPVVPVNRMMKKPKVVMGIPYWVVILMILITLGIVVGAGVFGLYWNKIL
jgi:hypothetical protein